MDSDALISMGLAEGSYTCPYFALQKTGVASAPYSAMSAGSREVTITMSSNKAIRFAIKPESLYPVRGDEEMLEFLSPVASEPGVFGSGKNVYMTCGDSGGYRTVIMVPSAMGLSANQAWRITKEYLTDPFNPANK